MALRRSVPAPDVTARARQRLERVMGPAATPPATTHTRASPTPQPRPERPGWLPEPPATTPSRPTLTESPSRATDQDADEPPPALPPRDTDAASHATWADTGEAVEDRTAAGGTDHAPRRSRATGHRRPGADGILLVLSPRAVVALVVLGCVAVLLGGCQLLGARPADEAVPPRVEGAGAEHSLPDAGGEPLPPSAGPPTMPSSPATAAGDAPVGGGVPTTGAGAVPTTGPVLVHVAGRVQQPGVVRLPAGARVADAVSAAGGPAPKADLSLVNLARPVTDGEQVLVPEVGAAPVAGVPPPAGGPPAEPVPSGAAPNAPLDLNTATAEQLQELPGVGPVLAGRIVEWRARNGRFTTVEELGEVTGIGERKLADITPRVRV